MKDFTLRSSRFCNITLKTNIFYHM